MATAADVARAQAKLHEALAKRLDDAPTGVVPGFNAGLGGTVLPNGKLRYVGGASAGGITGLASFTTSGSQTIPDSTDTIVNYDTKVTDIGSLVTTGASWSYAAPVDGLYIVIASLAWSAVDWAAGVSTRIKVYQNNPDGFNVWNLDWQSHAQGAANVRTLHGVGYIPCTAGNTLDVEAYQESGSDQDTLSVNTPSVVTIWCLLPT